MKTDFIIVDILDSVRKTIELSLETGQDCFPVFDQGVMVGFVTYKELMNSHPNRIVADAMTKEYNTISSDATLWECKDIFDNNDTCFLLAMNGDILEGIVERYIVYTEIARNYDTLTGLYRSNYLYYKAVELLEKTKEISVIFIDIDNFGRLNKTHGHMFGDMILSEIAELLKSNLPEDIYLCRYGGDEFAVLTTYTDEKCKEYAEFLSKLICSKSYCHKYNIKASIGVAGGRRKKSRIQNPVSVIQNLVNMASVASTKAKSREDKLHVAKQIDFDIA